MTLRKAFPLSWRKVIKKSIARGWRLLLLLLILEVLLFLLGEDIQAAFQVEEWGYILLAISLSWFAWLLWYPFYEFLYLKLYFYDIKNDDMIIRKGVFLKEEAVLRFSSIAEVYIDQDFLDLLLGLYDVHISTPTVQSGIFAHIDGQSKRNAEALRAMLIDHINRKVKGHADHANLTQSEPIDE